MSGTRIHLLGSCRQLMAFPSVESPLFLLSPWNPWTLSMESLEKAHGFHGMCPGSPLSQWTFSRLSMESTDYFHGKCGHCPLISRQAGKLPWTFSIENGHSSWSPWTFSMEWTLSMESGHCPWTFSIDSGHFPWTKSTLSSVSLVMNESQSNLPSTLYFFH